MSVFSFLPRTCRAARLIAPEKVKIDTKNGLKAAKEDPNNDPKRVRQKISPSHAT